MGIRIYREDIEIVKKYIGECMEGLESLEKEILQLEVRPEDLGLIHSLFQRVHRMKGGASFIGLPSITRLCREMELILEAIQEGRLVVDTGFIDGLLLAEDFLLNYLIDLEEKIKGQAFSGENGLRYFELDNERQVGKVLEALMQAVEDCKVKEEKAPEDQPMASIETELEMLQSKEFQRGLTEGIKEQFLLENTEHIERIENELLIRLDTNGADREAIVEIFRAVHSMKGGTGIYLATLSPQSQAYAGVKSFSEVVHTFESLLTLIRDRGCKFESKLVDLCFSVMDYLKSFLRKIATDDFTEEPNEGILEQIQGQLSRIQAISENPVQAPTLPPQLGVSKGEDAKGKGNMPQSIRVSQDKIDKMMNMVSELLIAKNSFMHLSAKLNREYDLPEISKEVKQVGANVNRISDELQNAIMSIRMVEIKTIFQKMPRVVRDIAQSTGKKMTLAMEGETTEIDKTIIEQISDPLVHLIRNAADHGVETPQERLAKGKPETGTIVLRAYNKNKHVFIEIEDDGKGIDAEKMKEKAIEKGFITSTEAERMSRHQLLNLIFLPGFSTAKQITEISGRGVGMDIVKSNIAKLSGTINIESEVDRGTKVIIQLPLSLAVSRGLIVEVSGENYIIPLEYIVETVKIKKNSIHQYSGKCFTYLRGEVIGVEWLAKIFLIGERDTEREEMNAVILTNGVENFAIVVDKLKNEQEFVVKALEGHLASIPGISGSTLLGNGQVVLIVNPVDLMQMAER